MGGGEGKRGGKGGTYLPMNRFLTSAAIRGSISTATHFLTFSRIRTVRLPVPGPTSSTTSVGLRNAWESSQPREEKGSACASREVGRKESVTDLVDDAEESTSEAQNVSSTDRREG